MTITMGYVLQQKDMVLSLASAVPIQTKQIQTDLLLQQLLLN